MRWYDLLITQCIVKIFLPETTTLSGLFQHFSTKHEGCLKPKNCRFFIVSAVSLFSLSATQDAANPSAIWTPWNAAETLGMRLEIKRIPVDWLLCFECLDIDECSTGRHSCPQGTQCQNTVGFYKCTRITCPSGQELDADGSCKRKWYSRKTEKRSEKKKLGWWFLKGVG